MADAAKPGKGYRILIIDDDAFLSGLYGTKLANEGFEVFASLDGEAGLKAVESKKPDLILLDVLMPKLDGFEVLRMLKSNPATKAIPVMMLTSLGQQGDIERGLKEGATDYLVKTQTLPTDAFKKIIDQLREKK